mmetsp:Transcript_105/g.214  ORF Transcript_105/g.214 Transcript_105/m.214 type:complete len:208 (-) Transcript_105:59-682(-)
MVETALRHRGIDVVRVVVSTRTLSLADAKAAVQDSFRVARETEAELALVYFSGHGTTTAGDWVFTDGFLSLKDIVTMWRGGKDSTLAIVADSCYSGKWVNELQRSFSSEGNILMQAGCGPDSDGFDSPEGGAFTREFADALPLGLPCPELPLLQKPTLGATWGQPPAGQTFVVIQKPKHMHPRRHRSPGASRRPPARFRRREREASI